MAVLGVGEDAGVLQRVPGAVDLGDGTVNPTRKPVTLLPAGSAIMRVATTETGKSSFAY
ncbi:hypothetical protein ACFCZY_14540 [Streptomyces sp. NPDC056237]|uniref:hypothetical protein n=1 Tax=Streptomyces sp. NPDC056237 TaxID=3345758 RepID=UPI0035DB7302